MSPVENMPDLMPALAQLPPLSSAAVPEAPDAAAPRQTRERPRLRRRPHKVCRDAARRRGGPSPPRRQGAAKRGSVERPGGAESAARMRGG
eukprot:2074201-Pyramimonas_sp.AAC.1